MTENSGVLEVNGPLLLEGGGGANQSMGRKTLATTAKQDVMVS